MKPIYIAGPMTGYPGFNFPAFEEAAATLRGLGHNIISPAEMDAEDGTAAVAAASPTGSLDENGKINNNTWGDLLARDVKLISDECGGICLLPQWFNSKGAILECTVAMLCKYPLSLYVDGNMHVYSYYQAGWNIFQFFISNGKQRVRDAA